MSQPVTESLYEFVLGLPRFRWDCLKKELPGDGIYFFFEVGETFEFQRRIADRIVRVGTHWGDGNFPGRIRQHYGHMTKLGGNKNGSVFRRHVGGALLRRVDEQDRRLETRVPQGGLSHADVEAHVSEWMRQNLSFSCVKVHTKDERLQYERGLIALLTQQPLGKPSGGWLGRWAVSETIQKAGLWNTLETGATPMTSDELTAFKEVVTGS